MKTLVITTLCALVAGCAEMTPEQTVATANAISSVVTTTGAVVTPLIINYSNGKSVRVRPPKPTPTPKPKRKKA